MIFLLSDVTKSSSPFWIGHGLLPGSLNDSFAASFLTRRQLVAFAPVRVVARLE